MKRSVRAFFSLAFSTSSRMRDTVDSAKGAFTFTRITPVMLMQPETAATPGSTTVGTLSPVSALVSSWLLPSTTSPSSGTRSPGLTTITSPTATVAGSTCMRLPSSSSTLAKSGAMSIMAAIDLRVFLVA